MTKAATDPGFDRLLEHLRDQRGFDFTGYKPGSLQRRIRKRMDEVGADTHADYQEHLELHPEEFPLLFNTVLVRVTGFFRDPPAWKVLADEVLPRILESKEPHEPVRAWVAGCATGEEAYTLAMLLAEAMGREPFVRRAKIYASDLDREALDQARLAAFSPSAIQDVPEDLRARYFELDGTRQVFRSMYRRAVVFGALDLVRDAPISHVDLVVCRNTLMYFDTDLQARVVSRFHYALNDPGFLFLGRAEMLLRHADLFQPVELKNRIFRKLPKQDAAGRLTAVGRMPSAAAPDRELDRALLREAALEADAYAQVVLDENGRISLINDRACSAFGLGPRDVGRPFQDLELSYRPAELRTTIEDVQTERRPRTLLGVERGLPAGGLQFLDITVAPIANEKGRLLGINLTFLDVTESRSLRDALRRTKQELETAHEELQSTVEELETTNEELQSTIEELETTNEELQSSNEELQTMNEELQSSNEELHTINEVLQERGDSLLEADRVLESLLGSLHTGVAIVDADLVVTTWNARAEEMWGLRQAEVVGRPLPALGLGPWTDSIRDRIAECLAGRGDGALEAPKRGGDGSGLRIRCVPFRQPDGPAGGAVLVMEDPEEARGGRAT